MLSLVPTVRRVAGPLLGLCDSDRQPIYFRWRPNLPILMTTISAGTTKIWLAARVGSGAASEIRKMKTIAYRCDTSRHKALLSAARASGTSVQRLFDSFVTHVITERQAEARFVARQKRGNPERGRKLLAEIRQRIASESKK